MRTVDLANLTEAPQALIASSFRVSLELKTSSGSFAA
jgi:hypothetical protein